MVNKYAETDNDRICDLKNYSGFIAILGAPNAGKSTLLNNLVGTKVAIVTHKVQTTRNIIQGIVTEDDKQAIFIDTPGIFEPKGTIDNLMVKRAWSGAKDADIITLIIDGKVGLSEANQKLLERISKYNKPKILIINKIDLVRHEVLLELIDAINKKYDFNDIFLISAIKAQGIRDYLEKIFSILPEGPFYFDPEQASNIPMRNLAAEITREKIFLRMHKELPYSTTVCTESYEERQDGSIHIRQVIYVEREGQKKIILGNKGSAIKSIGQDARQELSFLLGCKVHLFLFVKVQPNWKVSPENYDF